MESTGIDGYDRVHSGVGDSVGGSVGDSVDVLDVSSQHKVVGQQTVAGQPNVAGNISRQNHKILADVPPDVGNRVGGDSTPTDDYNRNQADDIGSDESTRERSTTPIESDLLKYLTAHITPPEPGGITSFVISREEYLRGIVQLVKSDCPEVVDHIDSFMSAMQQAFKDATTHAHIPCV